jgi:peptide/nickel transport system ATP-binding protein
MYAGNLCEHADVNDLFRQPKHPYTQALLNSVPRLNQHGPLQSIDGAVPNLVEPPAGCRFHPRCPLAKAPCRRHFPEMREVGANHFVACFEYTDQPRQPAPAGRG